MVNSEFKLHQFKVSHLSLRLTPPFSRRCVYREPLSEAPGCAEWWFLLLSWSSFLSTGLTIDIQVSSRPLLKWATHSTSWFWHQALLGGPAGSQSLLSASLGALGNSICFLGPPHTTWAYPNSTSWPSSLSHRRPPMQTPRQGIHLVAFKKWWPRSPWWLSGGEPACQRRRHEFWSGTLVWSLVREDPTCRGETKPMHHKYGACAGSCYGAWELQLLSPSATTTEACALQQEKTSQQEASLLKLEKSPARQNERKASAATKTQHSQK